MPKLLSKRQKEALHSYIKNKKEDDTINLTDMDRLIEVYLEFRQGIKENGFTIPEILEILGETNKYHWRSTMCQTCQSLYKDGFPFGGLKPGRGKLMRYGWAGTEEEKEQIQLKIKKNLRTKIRASLPYLNEEDKVKELGEKIIKECDKQFRQLKLLDI
jgi:hypothetical protein